MFGRHIFEEVTSKPGETTVSSPAEDVEKNVKAMLSSTLNRMGLVTRKESDIQQQMLIRTRIKLVELKEHLAKPESARISEETVSETAETTGQARPIE